MSESDDLRRRFNDIVAAGWTEEATPDDDPAAAGGSSSAGQPAGPAGSQAGPAGPPAPAGPQPVRDSFGIAPWVNPPWRGSEVPLDKAIEAGDQADDDETWVPPPPRALPPIEDFGFWGALLGLTVGPLLLLWLVLARPVTGAWVPWFALLITVAGFVLLVMRRGPRDPQDRGDNGAVV